jgi:peptide/nickel transport system substrate-binding protein
MRFIVIGCVLTLALAGWFVTTQGHPPTPQQVQAIWQHTPANLWPVQSVPAQPKPLPVKFTYKNGVDWRISPYPSPQQNGGQRGGSFTQALLGQGPKTFNPWAGFDATSSAVAAPTLLGLTDTDPFTGEVVPMLAREVQVSPDGTTLTVPLRRGLRWSDGHLLTRTDVLFTWNVILKQGLGNPSMQSMLLVKGQFPKVEPHPTQPDTVVFTTAEPFAPFLRSLSVPIAPAHVFKPLVDKGGDAAFSAAWGSQQAAQQPKQLLASGAWQLAQYQPGQRVVYTPNPHYASQDAEGGKLPYLDRLVYLFAKNDSNAHLLFEQGLLDSYTVPASLLPQVRRHRKRPLTLWDVGPTGATTFVAFNLRRDANPDTGQPLVAPKAQQWLNSLAFRQAFNLVLHRQRMVDNLLKGIGEPLFTAEGLNSLYLHPTLRQGYAPDVAKAKALLKAAGFSWRTPDGHLLDPQGTPVALTLLTNSGNDLREASCVQVQQDLATLGVTVHVKPMEFNTLVQRLRTGQWELMLMGLSGGSTFEPHFSANVWRSDGPLHLMNQRDLAAKTQRPLLPWERELDGLFDAGVRHTAFEARAPYYWQFQQLVADNALMAYLYSPKLIEAVAQRVQNVAFTPLATWHNTDALWIKDDQASPKP